MKRLGMRSFPLGRTEADKNLRSREISEYGNEFGASINVVSEFAHVFIFSEELSIHFVKKTMNSINLRQPALEYKGFGSPVVKVSDHGRHVLRSGPVPLKTRRVGERCTLHLSRAQTSSRWCCVVVRREGASLGVVLDNWSSSKALV
ncbi:uncharacterized protein TNCV_3839151 [Trichonephila clavipes]|nr:uncharacterized protein TNCV_3839151 [Trichonephila clavipes]